MAWALAGALPLSWALAQSPASGEAADGPAVQPAAPAASAQAEEAVPAGRHRRRVRAGGVDAQLQRLTVELKLDGAQQSKIRPILMTQREDMLSLQRDAQLTNLDRRQRVLALADRSADEIRAQLTDAQRAQYIKPRTQVPAAVSAPAAGNAAALKADARPARK